MPLSRVSLAIAVGLLSAGPVLAQAQSDQTNPQSSASTTVKEPAGVSKQPAMENTTQGMTGAETGCKSASAEMTNGAVETCKK